MSALIEALQSKPEYALELEESRCEQCGKGEGWTIVDREGVGNGVTYYDQAGAQEICDDLNEAFNRGALWVIRSLGLPETTETVELAERLEVVTAERNAHVDRLSSLRVIALRHGWQEPSGNSGWSLAEWIALQLDQLRQAKEASLG